MFVAYLRKFDGCDFHIREKTLKRGFKLIYDTIHKQVIVFGDKVFLNVLVGERQ